MPVLLCLNDFLPGHLPVYAISHTLFAVFSFMLHLCTLYARYLFKPDGSKRQRKVTQRLPDSRAMAASQAQ